MNHSSWEISEFKTNAEGPKGLFAARVSVFDNVDKNGDRVLPGAFKKSIAAWRERAAPIPVIWSHNHKDPNSYIGEVQPGDITETGDGLVVAGKMDIQSNPLAARVFDLLQKGRVRDWSFGYEVKDERLSEDLVRELAEVDLIEVGPTLVGANPETRTLVLKEAGMDEQVIEESQSTEETQAEAEPVQMLQEGTKGAYMARADARALLEEIMGIEAEMIASKAVDNGTWSGNRAMTLCSSASDYRSICAAEHTIGTVDQRQHWAGPHHMGPDNADRPNADGVRAALARWGTSMDNTQVQNITEAQWRRGLNHLQAHMREINPDYTAPGAASVEDVLRIASGLNGVNEGLLEIKIGRVISAKTEASIRQALEALQGVLELLVETPKSDEAIQTSEQHTHDEPRSEVLRRQIDVIGAFLAERGV